MEARATLAAEGIQAAVVSLPCWELFDAQDEAYRAAVLGGAPRVGIEAAGGFGWERWLGPDGVFIGMTGFRCLGAGRGCLYKHFGITAGGRRRRGAQTAGLIAPEPTRSSREGNDNMAVKVAINGFGRIGRLVLRAIVESGRDDVVPVAINDLGSVEANAHLFAYDSVHGRFPGQIEVSGNTITIRHNGKVYGPLTVSAERDPTKVPYQGVDVALECTGIFTSKAKASALLTAGARKVLISAPGDEVDATIVYGVNHKIADHGR